MSFTDIFIKKPVLATVVSLFILLLGLKSLFSLDLRQYPKVENTTITVTTTYVGASAETMQGFITAPLQSAISAADGIDTLTSSSAQSVSTITARLRLNYNADKAFTDIVAKVNSVKSQLPRSASDPVINKSSSDTIALLYTSYTSDKLSRPQIYDFLSRIVQPKLQAVPGVSTVEILGGNPFALRIWLDPKRMAALNVTTDDVSSTLTNNNVISAAGQLKGVYTITTLNAETDLHDAEEFKNLVVRQNKQRVVRLKDVATIELGAEHYSSSVLFNGKKGVFIAVNALPGANPLTVIKDVLETLPTLETVLPPTLNQNVVYNSTKFISAAIDDVFWTLGEATLIVILVIFLFIGNLRSILIPIVTIPLSLIGVGSLMLLFGYSLNLLTLLAMVLAIGLVVDDAIVVLENIYRHIEEGLTGVEAAIKGAREIWLPVITMTITLAAVYVPIGFTTGLTGALFKEFAMTLAASVVVSGIVALTLSPMMCSKLLKHDTNENSFSKKVDRVFSRLEAFYSQSLRKLLGLKPVVVVFGSVVLFSIYFLYSNTQKELAPKEDQGFLAAFANGPSFANLNYTEKYSSEIGNIFNALPEKEATFQINGMGAENSSFTGLVLKPWNERKRSTKVLQPILQEEINKIPGLQAFVITMPDLPTGNSGSTPVQIVIKSLDSYQNLYDITEKVLDKARKSGKFIFIKSDLQFDKPQMNIVIDRNKAADMHVSMSSIGRTLGGLLGGDYINFFSMQGRSYKVISQLPSELRQNPEDLNRIYVRSESGKLYPLSSFVNFKEQTIPPSLNQFSQLNSATISAVPIPGQTVGSTLKYMQKTLSEMLPNSMSFDYSGDSRIFIQEGSALLYSFLFALIVIFLVLSAQFESFRDPLVIMVSVPMAICGALIPLNLGVTSLNIYSQIGLVTLIGLITKHGILMVEFANKLKRNKNLSLDNAIEQAASIRLRPILMTTAAMVFGTLPLVIASGAGAASRFSIGIVIVTGLTVGTIFTLFIVPIVYTLISAPARK